MKFLFTTPVLHLCLLLLFNLVQPNYGEKYGGLQHSGLHPPSLAQFQSMIKEHKWTDCLNWATIVTHNPKSLKNRYGYYLQHFLFFPKIKMLKSPLPHDHYNLLVAFHCWQCFFIHFWFRQDGMVCFSYLSLSAIIMSYIVTITAWNKFVPVHVILVSTRKQACKVCWEQIPDSAEIVQKARLGESLLPGQTAK